VKPVSSPRQRRLTLAGALVFSQKEQTMVVDYQTHWYPSAYLDSIVGRSAYPHTEIVESGYLYEGANGDHRVLDRRFFDLEPQLADMDEHGIDVMVCSPNLVGEVTMLPLEEARETAQLLNEEMARAQRELPGRFVGLAMLPMQDAGAAIETLDDAVLRLGLSGVCILSHIAGRPIAAPETLPIYRRIAELGVPVFLHPANRSSLFHDGEVRPIENGLNWVVDTSRAALSLMLTGTLDACPGLAVVHPHTGGVLPYVISRIAATARPTGTTVEQPPATERSPEQYLRERFYADTVNPTAGALALAISAYGLERILLATDYPWQPRGPRLADVHANADEAQVQAIFHENVPAGLRLPAVA
jgi:predicted TIM-barrel fold metal-dependent hydrolase